MYGSSSATPLTYTSPSSLTSTVSPGRPMTRLMNGVSSLGPVWRRVEHDDVAAVVVVPARRQLVDEDVLAGLQGPLHRLLLHLVRLRDEGLDDEEDDERQDEGLDDLEEAPEAVRLPRAGSIG